MLTTTLNTLSHSLCAIKVYCVVGLCSIRL